MDGTSHNADKPGAAEQGKPRSKQRSRKPKYSHETVFEAGEAKEQLFDEREVVRRAQQRDLSAIGELCDHYIEGVHRYFYRKVWDVSFAEELTAETFCRVVEDIGQFRWQGKRFESWVRGIARHVLHERLREIKKEALTEPLTEPSDDQSLFSSNSEALIDMDANILEGIIWKEECQVPESLHTKIKVNKGESVSGLSQQTDWERDTQDSHEVALDCKS